MSQKEEDVKVTKTLAGIKNRIRVFSGKGGVGKSTVSANLALGLSLRGKKVGALDVDIHGPNLAKMLGAEGRRPGVTSPVRWPSSPRPRAPSSSPPPRTSRSWTRGKP